MLKLVFNYNFLEMKTDRRKFIQQLSVGAGALATGLPSLVKGGVPHELGPGRDNNEQHFNMCGYAAPKIETVRIGVIGLGMRGSEAVGRLSYIDGVEIVALCDKYRVRMAEAKKTWKKSNLPKPRKLTGKKGGKPFGKEKNV